MDSLTQIVLGASVGEAVLGKKVGNKALGWGAVAGTIPDLDVLADFFLDDLQSLLFHRGITHSIFFAVLVAPLLAFMVYKLHNQERATYKDWCVLFFLAIVTHPLLDIFTNYGTQIFYPFSSYRVSFNTIFVVDPLYTLPLIIGCIMIFFNKKDQQKRKKINSITLIISSVYLLLTCFNKLYVQHNITTQLSDRNIEYDEVMTTPAPFSNILWSIIVKGESGFHVGYFSLFDPSGSLELLKVADNKVLLDEYLPNEKIEALMEFSKGYFVLQKSSQGLILNDLRFSTISGWFNIYDEYIFSFNIKKEGRAIKIERKEPDRDINLNSFKKLGKRAMGKNIIIDER